MTYPGIELETQHLLMNSWRYEGKHNVLWDAHCVGLSVVVRIKDKLGLKVLTLISKFKSNLIRQIL